MDFFQTSATSKPVVSKQHFAGLMSHSRATYDGIATDICMHFLFQAHNHVIKTREEAWGVMRIVEVVERP